MGKEKWEKAMDEEMDALEANAIWELVPLGGPLGFTVWYHVSVREGGYIREERYIL